MCKVVSILRIGIRMWRQGLKYNIGRREYSFYHKTIIISLFLCSFIFEEPILKIHLKLNCQCCRQGFTDVFKKPTWLQLPPMKWSMSEKSKSEISSGCLRLWSVRHTVQISAELSDILADVFHGLPQSIRLIVQIGQIRPFRMYILFMITFSTVRENIKRNYFWQVPNK